MATIVVADLAAVILCSTALSQQPQPKPIPEADQGEGVSLTIYNQDFAVVRERRLLELPKGRGTLRFRDVAATIVPETMQFTCLSQPDAARVVEQSYEFDLVNADKLLEKYVDREITISTREGDTLKGKLLSYDQTHLTLQTPLGIDLVPRAGHVKDLQFSALPEGLLTRPTLVWLVDAKQPGKQLVKVAYAAENMTWRADYRAHVNQAGDKMNLAGWVTVTNETGTTFMDAKVKLMAGDVHLLPRASKRDVAGVTFGPDPQMPVKASSFGLIQKDLGEYHLYELQQKTTITDHATKQIELLNVDSIPVIRKYQTARDEDRVDVMLEFKNSEAVNKGLGVPLPKGPIRAYQAGADGVPEFVGYDALDHTPKDELVRVRLGSAFDLKMQRIILAERKTKEKWTIDHQIKLRNHKPVPVAIDDIEPLKGRFPSDITANSQPFERRDTTTLVFHITVAANAESVINYTVQYTLSPAQSAANVRDKELP